MANPSDVLFQLQSVMNSKYMIKNAKVNTSEDLEEDIGSNTSSSTGAGFGSSLANKRYSGDTQDLDAADAEAVDTPYTTNRPISLQDPDFNKRRLHKTDVDNKSKMEQIWARLEQAAAPAEPGGEEEFEAKVADEVPQEGPPEGGEEIPPPEGGEEVPEEPGMEGEMPGGEEGMAGMGGEEPLKTPSELGRIYELKKIYTRLTTIESYLSSSSDPPLLRIRLLVSKAIELFEILASNIPSYRPPKAPPERVDEIIIMYYKFLKQVYESVASHFKEKKGVLDKDSLYKATIKISDKELL